MNGRNLPGLLAVLIPGLLFAQQVELSGGITDPQGKAVAGATVYLDRDTREVASVRSDGQGRFRFHDIAPGPYKLRAEAPGFAAISRQMTLPRRTEEIDLQFEKLSAQKQTLVITAKSLEPEIDMRNAEVFNRTLFTRDDQVLQQLNAGINAGQHEGGGKSLEIRRFGFNLDHGGVNGGLKVLVDDVQQNQGTQGHGQGYLGALKALSPELIQDVTIINGPFSAEYGDFSGLGVVHIRQRESLPDQFTARLQGGNFDTGRGFFAFSPDAPQASTPISPTKARTPTDRFRIPGDTAATTSTAITPQRFRTTRSSAFRFLFGRNDFYSSGQIPLDLVSRGPARPLRLYRSERRRPRQARHRCRPTTARSAHNGDTFKADGFVSRSLFDLYSNFTFFLNDPVHGDAFQQHDSRLQEGVNAQYTHAAQARDRCGRFCTAGANFHDNQINVGCTRARAACPGRDHARPRSRHQRRRLRAGERQPAGRPAAAGRRPPLRRIPLRRRG